MVSGFMRQGTWEEFSCWLCVCLCVLSGSVCSLELGGLGFRV